MLQRGAGFLCGLARESFTVSFLYYSRTLYFSPDNNAKFASLAELLLARFL
nr:MAG TPA: hypothetical protein [Caudoviricetes sp.]